MISFKKIKRKYSACTVWSDLIVTYIYSVQNLQYREDRPHVFPKVEQVGLFSEETRNIELIVKTAVGLETAR